MKDFIKISVIAIASLTSVVLTYESLIDISKEDWSLAVGITSCIVGMFIVLILLSINLKLREIDAYNLIFKDTLTKAYNRRMLLKVFNEYHSSKKPFTLVYIDIDKFKQINDRNGHTMGDLVLIKFTERILNTIKSKDTFIRLGGDEFVLILDGNLSEDTINKVLKRISKSLDNSFALLNTHLYIKISMGYARYPYDAEELVRLIDIADSGMYREKRSA